MKLAAVRIDPRYCHTEYSKSDRERQILYDITYMWNLKNKANEIFIKQTQRHRKQTYGHQKGKGEALKKKKK